MSSQTGGVHILGRNLAASAGFGVYAIPRLEQILKVFVPGLAGHNGWFLKSPSDSFFEIDQLFLWSARLVALVPKPRVNLTSSLGQLLLIRIAW
ncbi:hypothetical protein ACFL07_11755 [Pseudomonadota bacterium]|jgi:hypothetical protein